jgi:hypothetical protein
VTAHPRKAMPVPAAPPKPDFAALLAGAKLPERTIEICLRADLVADFEELDRQLTALVEKPNPKMGDDGRFALRMQLEGLEAEMKAATYPFRLRALPKPKFRAMIAEHPPRRDQNGDVDERDLALRLNIDTFFDAIARACVIDPVLDDATWATLVDALTSRQFDLLASTAWGLNREDVNIPFSRGVLKMSRNSEPE